MTRAARAPELAELLDSVPPAGLLGTVLVLTGADDPIVPACAVRGFEEETRRAGAPDRQIVTDSPAMHAFAVAGTDAPEHGARFDPVANRRAWTAMSAFLHDASA